jgi:signal recognition particle subunit SRP54
MDALDEFHPQRIANRILGMGDIVSLVEKAAQSIDQEKAKRIAERMRKGKFDLDDMREQLGQVEKIGGLGGLMGMIPGIAKMKDQIAAANLDGKVIGRQIAIINSMTPAERRNPDVLKASRKKRIAAGSGTKVEEVNRLLKSHRQMADMMKMMGQGGKRGPMAGLANMFGMGGGGGMPNVTPEMLEQMRAKLPPGTLPPDMPGLPPAGKGGGLPPPPPGLGAPGGFPGLPGLGGKPTLPGLGGPKLPGLGGFNPFGKKK